MGFSDKKKSRASSKIMKNNDGNAILREITKNKLFLFLTFFGAILFKLSPVNGFWFITFSLLSTSYAQSHHFLKKVPQWIRTVLVTFICIYIWVEGMSEINHDFLKADLSTRKSEILVDMEKMLSEKHYKKIIENYEQRFFVLESQRMKHLYIEAIKSELREQIFQDWERNEELYSKLMELEPNIPLHKNNYEKFHNLASNLRRENKVNQERKEERRKKIENKLNPWTGAHKKLEKYLISNLKFPNTYKHIKTSYSDLGEDAIVVTTEFSAKNSFGVENFRKVRANITLDGKILNIYDAKDEL